MVTIPKVKRVRVSARIIESALYFWKEKFGHGGKRIKPPFWKVNKKGCWIWLHCKDYDGYGLVKINYRMYKVHRLLYEMVYGPIPEGLFQDHKFCDTPSCVHPNHVTPATHTQNIRRRHDAVINMNVARKIRKLRSQGYLIREIVEKLHLEGHRGVVQAVVLGKNWKE
jgi:hypothetical protein